MNTLDKENKTNHKFLSWVGCWISLFESIVNLIIVPFGSYIAWEYYYSLWLLKRKARQHFEREKELEKLEVDDEYFY